MANPLLSSTIEFDKYLKETRERSEQTPMRIMNEELNIVSNEEMRRKHHLAIIQRNTSLLSNCFSAWRLDTMGCRAKKVFEEEHSERKNMIHRLMSNLVSNTSALPSSSAKAASMMQATKKVSRFDITQKSNIKNNRDDKPELTTNFIKINLNLSEQSQKISHNGLSSRANTEIESKLKSENGKGTATTGKYGRIVGENKEKSTSTSNKNRNINKTEDNFNHIKIDKNLSLNSSGSRNERNNPHLSNNNIPNSFSLHNDQNMKNLSNPPLRDNQNCNLKNFQDYEDDFEEDLEPYNISDSEAEPEPYSPPPPSYDLPDYNRYQFNDLDNRYIDVGNVSNQIIINGQKFNSNYSYGEEKENSDFFCSRSATAQDDSENKSRNGDKDRSSLRNGERDGNRDQLSNVANPNTSSSSFSKSNYGRFSPRNEMKNVPSDRKEMRNILPIGRNGKNNQFEKSQIPPSTSIREHTPRFDKSNKMESDEKSSSRSIKTNNSMKSNKSENNSYLSDQSFDINCQREKLQIRANERKVRVSTLKKQAEDRVHQKLKEEERLSKIRDDEEVASLERLRQEKRMEMLKFKSKPQMSLECKNRRVQDLQKSDSYRRSYLLLAAFAPWCRLIDQARLNYIKAVTYNHDHILDRAWGSLIGYSVMQKAEKARTNYRLSSMATSFYRFKSHRRSFFAWKIAFEKSQRKMMQKIKSIKPKSNKIILRFYWQQWTVRTQEEQIEREVRDRSAATWYKVRGWIEEGKS